MKILWIIPITGSDGSDEDNIKEYLNKFTFPETEVIIKTVSRGTESIESRLDETYAIPPILDEALKGQKDGVDACIIGCGGDAGVMVAKEVLSIPVIGPGEASIVISQLIGKRVVVITTLPDRIPSLEDTIARLISPSKFFIYPIDMPVLELQDDVNKTKKRIVQVIKKSIEKDRADTAILSCLGMQGMARDIEMELPIPVIDPTAAAIEMAQVLVKMKLSQAKKAYPFPRGKRRFL